MSSQTRPQLHTLDHLLGRGRPDLTEHTDRPPPGPPPAPVPPSAVPAPTTVDAVLDEFFRASLERSAAYGEDYAELWQSLHRASQGGKRFRPALLTGIYRHLGGADERLACTLAAAVELLHTAFVVHDDVIDHDDVRRGRLNVSGTFAQSVRSADGGDTQAATLGAAAGILAGDLALTGALRLVASSTAGPSVREGLLALFDHAIYATAAGELSDVRYSLGPAAATLTEVVTMAANKTAVYSFELPLQAGAMLAGADRRTVAGLGHLGRLVGVAFQLHDDLDGVFGDEDVTGKSVLTDLREGKVTPLVAHSRETEQWPLVERHLGAPGLTHDQLHEVRAALEASGSRAFIEDLAEEQLASARRLAAELSLPPGAVGWLESMTRSLPWRSA